MGSTCRARCCNAIGTRTNVVAGCIVPTGIVASRVRGSSCTGNTNIVRHIFVHSAQSINTNSIVRHDRTSSTRRCLQYSMIHTVVLGYSHQSCSEIVVYIAALFNVYMTGIPPCDRCPSTIVRDVVFSVSVLKYQY